MVAIYGVAASCSDAAALAARLGPGARIGVGTEFAAEADILAPAGALRPELAAAALAARKPRYIFTFGNAGPVPDYAGIGPVMDELAGGSGTGFLCACFAAPWAGRTVYQGCLFQDGDLRGELRQQLAPHIAGAIAVVPQEIVTAGRNALLGQLTALKERGVRLALLDAIDAAQCETIAEALARQPVIAGPAWLAPLAFSGEPAIPAGPVAMLSGALHRQSLMQTALARRSMPVCDLDPAVPDAAAAALAWARPHLGDAAFLITSTAPPDRIDPAMQAAAILSEVAAGLRDAGIRNFLLGGSDTAAAILRRLEVTRLEAGAEIAGLRWLHGSGLNILVKPGGFGGKNLFLYDFGPQSRLNEAAQCAL